MAKRVCLGICLFLLAFSLTVCPVWAQSEQEKIEALKAQVKQLMQRIEQLEKNRPKRRKNKRPRQGPTGKMVFGLSIRTAKAMHTNFGFGQVSKYVIPMPLLIKTSVTITHLQETITIQPKTIVALICAV